MSKIQVKVCLLGDFAVGKTSMVRRFVEGRFDDKYLSSIGVKISRKVFDYGDRQLNLLLWDLAGGESFIKFQASYLRGASGAMIVCDLSRHETLGHLAEYAQQLRSANTRAAILFVGNKVDLDTREISDKDLQDISGAFESAFLLTSAKTGQQVEAAFQILAGQICQR